MSTYEFQGNYESFRDGRRFGPWVEGDVVQLDPADAEWIDRDSPGVLAEHGDDSELAAPPAVAGGARPRVSGNPDAADLADTAKQRLDAESVFRQTATGDGIVPGAAEEADVDEVPEGSATVVLAWVGSDPARAQAALDAETARNQPRTGLTAALERIASWQPEDRQHRGGETR